MDVIYNEDCLLHDPPFEATRGQVKPYLGMFVSLIFHPD